MSKKNEIKKEEKSKEEIMADIKKFSEEALKKYEKYIKAIVMMGSVVRDEAKPTSDVDVFAIADDTSFKLTNEFLDEMDSELEKIAQKINKSISIQPTYTLTEFWDYARVAHPIIYNFIKEGVAIYDTGFFSPIKKLLEMGRIPATREAIESYMEGAPKKLQRAKTVKLLMLAEDCYYAVLNSAQAVLMFMGLAPPVPSKAYDDVMEFLIKPGILEQQYADWLREIVDIRKKIEHKELLDVSGAFVDEWIDKSEKFVDRMFGLLGALEVRKKEKILERTHEVMQKAAITALKTLHKIEVDQNIENPAIDFNQLVQDFEKKLGSKVSDAFKRDFIDTKRIEPYYSTIWNRIEEMKKLANQKKITEIPDKDVYEMREYVRKLIRDLAKVLKEKEISDEGLEK
ncbi:MAG: nucleotidyltransferase domain-containing protein [Candidatus Aenigmarchaeota archaeon]|nr:nucleotidyltransferase domain-containing protein [Candidatus Aenigmarchaeota archaeon]